MTAKKSTLILFLMLISVYKQADAQLTISGMVETEDGAVLSGTILAYNPGDSSLLKGGFIEDNHFSLKLDVEEAIIEVKVIGFESYSELISESKQDYKIRLVELEALSGLSIKGERQLFEQSNGHVIVNVDNTVLSTMNNLLGLLEKSPGVVVSNGNISVVGKGDAHVYLDGQKISPDRLSTIPVAQIDRIEIINDPGVQYDAEGQAVIVIHLKKDKRQGYQASILQHYTKGYYHLYFVDANLNIQGKKWSLRMNLNNNLGATGLRAKNVLDLKNISDPYIGRTNYVEKTTLQNMPNYALGLNYKFSERSRLSVEYGGRLSRNHVYGNNTIHVNYDSGDSVRMVAKNNSDNLETVNSVSINYTFNTDTLGHQLFIGANYAFTEIAYHDQIDETQRGNNVSVDGDVISKGNNRNDLYTLQIDQSLSFLKHYELAFGAKYNQAELNSSIYVNNTRPDSVEIIDSSSYVYDEKIMASYISLQRSYDKWNFNLGVRLEHVDALAKQKGAYEPYYNLNRWNLFPKASLSVKGEKVSWHQSYTMRVSRPSYSNITPYYYYMNALTSIQGNPGIKPSYTHSLESKFTIQMASLVVGHNYSIDPALFINRVGEDGVSNVIQSVNISQLNSTYIQLAIPTAYKLWESYNMANISFNKYQDNTYDFGNDLSTPKLYLYTYHGFKVKDIVKLELIGEYQGRYADGSRSFLPNGALNIGASRTFGKAKQWYVQLFLNDMFRTSLYRAQLEIDGNQTAWNQASDTRFLRCLLKYRFGKLKEVDYEARKINEDALNRTK